MEPAFAQPELRTGTARHRVAAAENPMLRKRSKMRPDQNDPIVWTGTVFMQDTFEAVKAIVASQIGRDPSEITETTSLEEAGYDSLDVLETIFAIEERFDIRVPFDANDPSVKGLKTVGDIARIVGEALGSRAPA